MGQKSDPNNPETVIILPESDDFTLCVELAGTVRRADHENNIRRRLFSILNEKGGYNFMANFGPRFTGWEPEAAEISFQTIVEIGKFARKLAYVNPPEKKILQGKLAPGLFGGEMRNFSSHELKDAIAWVKS